MNLVDQLWTLQQIYRNENAYYDQEQDMHLHRIPTDISSDRLDALKQADRMPNQMVSPRHDQLWDDFHTLAETWTLDEAAGAFIAGLWSAPFLWQSALPAKLLSQATPRHTFTPYAGSGDTCKVCGFRRKAVDITYLWYRRMTGSLPLDGDPAGYVYALGEMAKSQSRPVPTAYDLWTFRAILTVLRQMPPKSRYSKVRDALQKEKLLPTSQKAIYCSLLEALALTGILDTPEHPGMATRFTTYQERDLRPSVRVEVQAPLAWWDSSTGINEIVLRRIFSGIDCSSVSLTDRPVPVLPLSRTVTGELAARKTPGKRLPVSPDAGKGPARTGDVYAVRIRENAWVTVYCHKVEDKCVIVEYLDGIFSQMPLKSQIISAFRPRSSGRWQAKASGLDRTVGVKRIARDIPAPRTELAEPERIPFATAASLKNLAWWCFPELS